MTSNQLDIAALAVELDCDIQIVSNSEIRQPNGMAVGFLNKDRYAEILQKIQTCPEVIDLSQCFD